MNLDPAPPACDGRLLGVGLGLTIGSRVVGTIAGFYAAAAAALIVISEPRTLSPAAAGERLGRFVLRLAIGNARTGEADVALAWDVLRRAGAGSTTG